MYYVPSITEHIPKPQACEHCCFFHKLIEEAGECRRHAPVLKGIVTSWPTLNKAQWCGDFFPAYTVEEIEKYNAWATEERKRQLYA